MPDDKGDPEKEAPIKVLDETDIQFLKVGRNAIVGLKRRTVHQLLALFAG